MATSEIRRPTFRPGWSGILPLLLLGVGACTAVTDPEERSVLAFIVGIDDDHPHTVVPATATAGVPFTVQVRTYGPSGCWRQGDTDALRVGDTVTLMPFDRVTDADVCTGVVMVFDHVTEVTFQQAGEARVVLRGRDFGSEEVVSFVFPITVEP